MSSRFKLFFTGRRMALGRLGFLGNDYVGAEGGIEREGIPMGVGGYSSLASCRVLKWVKF